MTARTGAVRFIASGSPQSKQLQRDQDVVMAWNVFGRRRDAAPEAIQLRPRSHHGRQMGAREVAIALTPPVAREALAGRNGVFQLLHPARGWLAHVVSSATHPARFSGIRPTMENIGKMLTTPDSNQGFPARSLSEERLEETCRRDN